MKINYIFRIILFAGLFLFYSDSASATIFSINKVYELGVEAHEKGDLKKASTFLEAAVDYGLTGSQREDAFFRLHAIAVEMKDDQKRKYYFNLCRLCQQEAREAVQKLPHH